MTADDQRMVTLDPSGLTFRARPGQRLLEAAREAGLWLPFECGWGSCGTCKASLIDGEVENLLPEAPAVSERDVRRGRVLLCQSAATTDVTVRPLRVEDAPPPGRNVRRLSGCVRSRAELTPEIIDLVIDVGEPLDFRPGQFAIVMGPDGLRRCYSLAGRPGETFARLVFKRYDGGLMSQWLAEVDSGAEVTIESPYGDVWVRPGDRPLLIVAGGTGISAVLSLASEAANSQKHRPLTLVYGARSHEDLVLLDELRAMGTAHGDAEIIAVAEVAPAGGEVRPGRVTDVLGELAPDEHDIYLAGPPGMVNAIEAVLDNHGVQRDRLFVDRFG